MYNSANSWVVTDRLAGELQEKGSSSDFTADAVERYLSTINTQSAYMPPGWINGLAYNDTRRKVVPPRRSPPTARRGRLIGATAGVARQTRCTHMTSTGPTSL